MVTASPCEAFGLVEATLPRHDLRPHSSPDHLREEVVPGGELLADLREWSGILVAPLRVQRLGEMRSRGRPECPVAHVLEREVTGAEAFFGGAEIPGQELDDPVDIRSRGGSGLPQLLEDLVCLGEELPGELEAAHHRV